MTQHEGTPGIEHIPARPSWDCRACGKPWPCDSAQEWLLIEYAGWTSVLAFYLNSQLRDAIHDGLGGPDAELYDRFQAWAR
jgi:hypothetical protein